MSINQQNYPIMQHKIVVNSEIGPLTFIANIHRADAPGDLHLSMRYFYKKWRKNEGGMPSFPHYEVELLNMQNFKQLKRGLKLHIHKSIRAKGAKEFMCYIADVPSQEAAILMWKAWCVGTVYSFIRAQTSRLPKDYDFAYPFGECKEDPKALITFMAQQAITLTE